ncbi:MAG: TldD/PmbA family protein [Deltaproteobacteria bacterium]|nr:TldD/PmbA family protein [Deltaproteobacteria bacterium]
MVEEKLENNEITDNSLRILKGKGADKASVTILDSEKHELYVENGKINLLRTTCDTSIELIAFKNNQRGSVIINDKDKISIENATAQVMENAVSSKEDDANDIAAYQESKNFDSSNPGPDYEKMYDRLKDFLQYTSGNFPLLKIQAIELFYTSKQKWFKNSNGVNYSEKSGFYEFFIFYYSKKDEKISSANFTSVSMKNLEKKLHEYGNIRQLLIQSVEQLDVKPLPGKFTGDIIITPECMNAFVNYFTSPLQNIPVIRKTSFFQGKLDKTVASPEFSLSTCPESSELARKHYLTKDGYCTENTHIIKDGILKSFILDLYGSRKTGKKRCGSDGNCYVIDPGNKSYDDIIKPTKKGLLLSRFSGGMPAANGDFSGVAKNSYYIEDGKITYPVSETMISGNLEEMLVNINSISKETTNTGNYIFPWISFSGIVVSGK